MVLKTPAYPVSFSVFVFALLLLCLAGRVGRYGLPRTGTPSLSSESLSPPSFGLPISNSLRCFALVLTLSGHTPSMINKSTPCNSPFCAAGFFMFSLAPYLCSLVLPRFADPHIGPPFSPSTGPGSSSCLLPFHSLLDLSSCPCSFPEISPYLPPPLATFQ